VEKLFFFFFFLCVLLLVKKGKDAAKRGKSLSLCACACVCVVEGSPARCVRVQAFFLSSLSLCDDEKKAAFVFFFLKFRVSVFLKIECLFGKKNSKFLTRKHNSRERVKRARTQTRARIFVVVLHTHSSIYIYSIHLFFRERVTKTDRLRVCSARKQKERAF